PTLPCMIKERVERDHWRLPFPGWFNQSFESRLGLRERWDELGRRPTLISSHPVRPVGYWSFHITLWEALFRHMDAGHTMAPVEVRDPFVDLRLLRYMLAVPAIPWCRAKYLELHAMRHDLPVSVLRRPKSPLTGDPAWEAARRIGLKFEYPARTLGEYVNLDRVPKEAGSN